MKLRTQIGLFAGMEPAKVDGIVNVASVPQRSPFRYPGGKTWLIPRVRQWLRYIGRTQQLVEPFAGGGIVSLTAIFENFTERAILVEKDPAIASVWHTMLNGKGGWLAKQIREFELSAASVKEVLDADQETVHERAFATILRNRVQRGGILAPGAGLVKEGENGKGLRSRWYPETLSNRILAIARVKNQFSFCEGDGLTVLRRQVSTQSSAFFIDPPYPGAGRRLYAFGEIDHEELFRVASQLPGHILMTYDECDRISKLADRFHFQVARVPMKSTHHVCKYELLIGKDLAWLGSNVALSCS